VAPVPAPDEAPVAVLPVAVAAITVPEHKKTQVVEYKKTRRIPALTGRALIQSILPKSKAIGGVMMGFCLATFAKLSGLVRWVVARFRRAEPKSVLPRLGKPAVQTLLSLDRVKVVRNSLEDSDLEVVTAHTATSTQVAPTTPVASPKRGPVPAALKKISERLLSMKALD